MMAMAIRGLPAEPPSGPWRWQWRWPCLPPPVARRRPRRPGPAAAGPSRRPLPPARIRTPTAASPALVLAEPDGEPGRCRQLARLPLRRGEDRLRPGLPDLSRIVDPGLVGASSMAPSTDSRSWCTDGSSRPPKGDSVYALDPASGTILWRRNLGTPVRRSTLPCGDIDPLGITGTPAYDPASSSLFVVAEVTGPHHVLFALDPESGAVRWSRDVDLPGDDPADSPAAAGPGGRQRLRLHRLRRPGRRLRPVHGQGRGRAGERAGRDDLLRRAGQPRRRGLGDRRPGDRRRRQPVHLDRQRQLNHRVRRQRLGDRALARISQIVSRFAPSTWAADNAGDADLGSTSPMLLPGGLVSHRRQERHGVRSAPGRARGDRRAGLVDRRMRLLWRRRAIRQYGLRALSGWAARGPGRGRWVGGGGLEDVDRGRWTAGIRRRRCLEPQHRPGHAVRARSRRRGRPSAASPSARCRISPPPRCGRAGSSSERWRA